MNLKKITLNLILLLTVQSNLSAQSSGNAQASSKDATVPVNNFTGIPSISIPLFNYGHQSGIGISFSLDYFAGGIKVNEAPSVAGLGWNVFAGGMVTRIVRSLPDDCPNKGFIYSPAIQADVRPKAKDYFQNVVDGEQDIFQFNFGGRSGKFYIGKDSQCIVSPQSKIKIQYESIYTNSEEILSVDTLYNRINKFIITTEDGVKYVFNNPEYSRMEAYNYIGSSNYSSNQLVYADAWNLSYIIAASGKDSIKFNYQKTVKQYPMLLPQTVQILNGNNIHSDTLNELFANNFLPKSQINQYPGAQIISCIELPDSKKVKFIYSNVGEYGKRREPVLQRINIMDSVFRYGYLFNWDTIGVGIDSKDFLRGINYYTIDSKRKGYEFTYNSPYFNYSPSNPNAESTNNYILSLNKKDHWGFYNGANNSLDAVPTVASLYSGANREPNTLALASSLSSVKDPSGGITYYDFENNDVFPYTTNKQTLNVDAASSTQNNITINKVLGNYTFFKIKFDPSFDRVTNNPITGLGQLNFSITDLSGATILTNNTIDLYEFYNSGGVSFSAAIPSGTYLFKTNLINGTASNMALPIIINWYNQTIGSGTGNLVGGIRIKQISHYDPFSNKIDTISTFKYIKSNGISSGFLSIKPVYDYINTYLGKQIIQSNALGELDYGHGNKVGYERVEVINGSLARNLGKQVFEYTNLSDLPIDISPAEFPFMQRKVRDWGLGLPKKISVYDNNNTLIQTTTNTYNFNITNLYNANNTSIKFAQETFGFSGEKYYPELGRADLASTTDTFYHPDMSITTKWKNLEYDTNYNLIKTTSPYDKNKNFNIEQRFYYPYNYTIGGVIGTMRDSSIYMPVSTETWLTGGSSSPRLISLSATDFQKSGIGHRSSNIFKPLITYALETNKPLLISTIGSFNPSLLVRNSNYIKPQQSFIYDSNGTILETTNSNTGLKNMLIYGNANAVIAKVSNAGYLDAAFTSFEKNSFGNWVVAGNDYDTINFFTGHRSYNLASGEITKASLNTATTYLLTYWTKGNVTFSVIANPTLIEQRNGWNLYSAKFTGASSITLYGNGFTPIDELRLHPIDANMESSTFDDFGNVLSTNDANNNIAYYEYDIMHRSKILRDKDKNIIKKIEYSDVITPLNLTPKWVQLDPDNDWSCSDDDLSTMDTSGIVYKVETDTNHLSETYTKQRYVYDHIDFNKCPKPVIAPACDWNNNNLLKLINNVCETAQKVCVSSVRTKVLVNGNYVFAWKCTFAYQWSDGNYSQANHCNDPAFVNSDSQYCSNGIYYFVEVHPTTCLLATQAN